MACMDVETGQWWQWFNKDSAYQGSLWPTMHKKDKQMRFSAGI